MLQLKFSDNGSDIELQQGDLLELILESNPTTGYQWEFEPDLPPILVQQDWEFTPYAERIGSSGLLHMRIQAQEPGSASLRVVYRRPFLRTHPPLHVFEITLEVRPAE